jgi:DNA-binding transcriptional ArsR family regulator
MEFHMRTETTKSVTQSTDATDLSPTAIFGLLADDHRLYALDYPSQRVGAVSFEELADRLAVREGSDSDDRRDRRDRIRASLVHHHLPRLADTGIVRYDPERGTVELRDASDRLRPYLQLAAADEAR